MTHQYQLQAVIPHRWGFQENVPKGDSPEKSLFQLARLEEPTGREEVSSHGHFLQGLFEHIPLGRVTGRRSYGVPFSMQRPAGLAAACRPHPHPREAQTLPGAFLSPELILFGLHLYFFNGRHLPCKQPPEAGGQLSKPLHPSQKQKPFGN